MDELTENLPLLPLTSGVVLPGMVFTMALESDEAKAAAEAAEAAGGHFVIVPFIDGRYASIGVVSEVMEAGELPGGMPAVAVRGIDRARLGTAVPGTGQALWVEVEHIAEVPVTEEATELAREYRAVVENILPGQGCGTTGRTPGRRDRSGPRGRHVRLLPRSVPGPEGRGPRDRRYRATAAAGHRLGPRGPRRSHPARADQDRRRRGHGEDPARVPAEAPARVDPQGAGTARGGRRDVHPTTTAAGSRAGTCPRPCARRSTARSTSSSG